ncbi:Putative sterigmatocystin biosynthesis lipase/esterase stcI [Listeria monocytogenes]|nr:Putative sterigmatocystin biosynthesis lipase/esterase stcI [Listeria monocytogenes]
MKNTSPLSDVDSRYKYMRLATKALPSAKDIEIGDVENKKIDGIPIRIYTPQEDGPFEIIVYYHGGGFVLGANA